MSKSRLFFVGCLLLLTALSQSLIFAQGGSGPEIAPLAELPLPDDITNSQSPQWSPGGEQVVIVSNVDGYDQLHVADPARPSIIQITHDPANFWYPQWSPDGTHIAYTSDIYGSADIFVLPVAGECDPGPTINADENACDPAQITSSEAGDYITSWSPSGNGIAFTSDRDGDFDMYIMGSDGSDVIQLTDSDAYDVGGVWSPDGEHIAFYSDRSGTWNIYIMDPDGTNVTQLTDGTTENRFASWHPSGELLVFVNTDEVGSGIIRMNADGTMQQPLPELSELDLGGLEIGSPAWSPDGSQLAVPMRQWDPDALHQIGEDWRIFLLTGEPPSED